MIYFNRWPLTCLTLAGTSAYYGFKMAKRALPSLLEWPCGSESIFERIDKAVQSTLKGSFSIRNFFFGSQTKRERIFLLLNGCSLFAMSVSLFFLAYICYYESLKLSTSTAEDINLCVNELGLYQKSLAQAKQLHEYWTQSLCEFEKDQWDVYLNEIQTCTRKSYLGYFQIKNFCQDTFTELTAQSYMKDLSLRYRVDAVHQDLKAKANEVQGICSSILLDTQNMVNQKCSYLHPYVGFRAKNMCMFLNYVPFIDSSQECTDACEKYMKQYNTVYSGLEGDIPRTKEIVIDCPKVLSQKKVTYPKEMLQRNGESLSEHEIKNVIYRQLSEYNGDWRNTTLLVDSTSSDSIAAIESLGILGPAPKPSPAVSILRTVIKDLKAKAEFTDSLEELKSSMPTGLAEEMDRNKRVIIR